MGIKSIRTRIASTITTMIMKKIALAAIATLACLSLPATAMAVPLNIISTPHNAGSFTPNVFHTSINGGGSGSILGWFDLDTTGSNTYDPDTGDLFAAFNIYSDRNHTNQIGSVLADGNLPAANFQGNGGLAGSIDWTFSFSIDNILQDYLIGQNHITLNYFDRVYTQTALGHDVNGWEDGYLSLWGAGQLDEANLICDPQEDVPCFFQQQVPYLGSDIIIQTASTPEPMSMALMASGFAGMLGLRKRKQS